MEKVILRFDGGIASEGRLHYYEYTRSQYATARFLSTIEHFRRTGKIAKRITSESYVSIYVETPQQGSFLEILTVKAQEAVAGAVTAQLGSLISWVWTSMVPRNSATDDKIIELAQLNLEGEKLRVDSERERSRQLELIEKIVETQSATTNQAIQLVDNVLAQKDSMYGRSGYTTEVLNNLKAELEMERQREKQIEADKDALAKIDSEKLLKLTSRLRPMLPEMALPLRRSATTLAIGTDEKQAPLLLLNRVNVAEIVEKELDETPVDIVVHVKSYDRDSGVGKVSSDDFERYLNFIVSPHDRARLVDPILAAMKKSVVVFTTLIYRDKDGEPTSLVVLEVSDIS